MSADVSTTPMKFEKETHVLPERRITNLVARIRSEGNKLAHITNYSYSTAPNRQMGFHQERDIGALELHPEERDDCEEHIPYHSSSL